MKAHNFSHVELGRLTHNLHVCSRNTPLVGYEAGKHHLQQLITRLYDCSRVTARRLVDHLEREGYVVVASPRRAANEKGRRHWRFRPTPNESARWLASA